jgi:hypothetical protein
MYEVRVGKSVYASPVIYGEGALHAFVMALSLAAIHLEVQIRSCGGEFPPSGWASLGDLVVGIRRRNEDTSEP